MSTLTRIWVITSLFALLLFSMLYFFPDPNITGSFARMDAATPGYEPCYDNISHNPCESCRGRDMITGVYT